MDNLKTVVARAMEAYYGPDARRIRHSYRVTGYAEELLQREAGDYAVVIAAGLLHDVGIPVAVKKYGSPAGKYQEKEGPPVAREILSGLGFPPDQTEEVCQIIAHHHSPGIINTINFKILFDADWLVNLRDEYNTADKSKLTTAIEKLFLTDSGKARAREIYLSDSQPSPK